MSDGSIIIDRRKNPKAKSLTNRQRFIERVKKQVKNSIDKQMDKRSIRDNGDNNISIENDGIEEPQFRNDPEHGVYDYVLPGNKDYTVGDTIDKPKGGGGGSGNGDEGSEDGEGEDEFQFTLTNEEYLSIVFDGLELPNLQKQSDKNAVRMKTHRAGFTSTGVPTNLNVERTAIAGLSRRIALKFPKLREIAELEALLENEEDEDKRREIEEEISRLRIRAESIRFLDNVDLRFNNFVQRPEPITQAVMFCVMDVSFSMDQFEKIIAKKFFLLLYLFLQRKYKKIEIVFVRHHTVAEEVDEETFFYDRTSGGTVISTAYEKVKEIITDRYPVEEWNIYMAQATDGDNSYNDNDRAINMLENDLVPIMQFITYVEIKPFSINMLMGFWDLVRQLEKKYDNLACTLLSDEGAVVSAFRKLFSVNREEQ
jgi:uncharacterized sporulation protein YeaH/YhbH (DUF444 family)